MRVDGLFPVAKPLAVSFMEIGGNHYPGKPSIGMKGVHHA